MALSAKEVEHVTLLTRLKLNAQEERLFPRSSSFLLEQPSGLFQLIDEYILSDVSITRTVMSPVSSSFFITLLPEFARCPRTYQ